MKQFFADWKNSALLGAGMLIIALIVLLILAQSNSMSAPIVMIGDKAITRSQFLNETKKRNQGNQVLTGMIMQRIVEEYARQEGISVTQAELDQRLRLDRLKAELNGLTLPEYYKRQGLTQQDAIREYRETILSVKLIVPEKDIAAALPRYLNDTDFIVPPLARYRLLLARSKEDAVQVVKSMAKTDWKADIEKLCQPGAAKELVAIFDPNDKSGVGQALLGLKPLQLSKPTLFTIKDEKLWGVVQLITLSPMQPPSMANSSTFIGEKMMRSEKYALAANELLANALQKVDVQFINVDFPDVKSMIDMTRLQNPVIPGLDATPSRPGATPLPGAAGSAPAAPGSMPAAPGAAPAGR